MEAFNPEWYQHLSISFCFENGSTDRSEQNLHEKVENKTSSSAFTLKVLRHIYFSLFTCFGYHLLRKVLRAYWTPVFNLLLAPSLTSVKFTFVNCKSRVPFFLLLYFLYMILISYI